MNASKNIKRNLKILKWSLPIIITLVSAFYQLAIARFVHDNVGHELHWAIEIAFYGSVGPIAMFWIISRIGQWQDEKEGYERNVRESERRLAAVSFASPDAILGIDKQGLIESSNRGAELTFGYSAEELVGQPLSKLFEGQKAAEQESQWLREAILRDGYLQEYEINCTRASGESFTVELSAARFTVEDPGQLEGLSIILRDITERKKREEEIRDLNTHLNELVEIRTQELDEKVNELAKTNERLKKLDQTRSEFVSLVSHQIRAPLTNIRGVVEKMQHANKKTGAHDQSMLAIIDQQVERLDRLVRDVLNTRLIEEGNLVIQKEPVSVLPLIKQAVDQFHARNQTSKVSLAFKPVSPLVYSDKNWVLEILANLFDNAAKYTSADGKIKVDTYTNPREVTISVRDTGPGIPPKDLQQVFEKFYRSDNGDSQRAYGYGLGLYICQSLVQAMNGKIWAENHPDGGAIFSFTLPVWQEEQYG